MFEPKESLSVESAAKFMAKIKIQNMRRRRYRGMTDDALTALIKRVASRSKWSQEEIDIASVRGNRLWGFFNGV